MAQNQPVKAIDVVLSNGVNIPKPGSVAEGADGTVSLGANPTFTSASSTFQTDFISGGDVVIATQGGVNEMAEIESVNSETELKLASPLGSFTAPISFKIYKGNGGALKAGMANENFAYKLGSLADQFLNSADGATALIQGFKNTINPLNIAAFTLNTVKEQTIKMAMAFDQAQASMAA